MNDHSGGLPFEDLDPAVTRLLPILQLDFQLRADVVRARNTLTDPPADFHRRQYVRAVFAQLEGSTFAMKQLAVQSQDAQLGPADLALLRGETYRLNDSGEAIVSPAFLTLPSDLRFAFRMYARSVGLTYELPVKERGWSALARAKKVRDRLMHPRNAADLAVTDEELSAVTEAVEWFEAQYQALSDLMIDQTVRSDGFSENDVERYREYRKATVSARLREES